MGQLKVFKLNHHNVLYDKRLGELSSSLLLSVLGSQSRKKKKKCPSTFLLTAFTFPRSFSLQLTLCRDAPWWAQRIFMKCIFYFLPVFSLNISQKFIKIKDLDICGFLRKASQIQSLQPLALARNEFPFQKGHHFLRNYLQAGISVVMT